MAPRDANWIDGLRGVASFMVVSGHLCTAFIPWLHSPAETPRSPPHIFQLPFFRLVVGGRAAVALFFLITGYVNAIGPIRRSRAGNNIAAFNGIARSALARSGRLILPTMIATAITWLLANMNAYQMTKHVDSTWIRQGWHDREPTLAAAFKSLVRAEIETWTVGWDDYDGTQWTLHLFLEGSMLVYTTMIAAISIKPKARFVVYAALYIYFWQQGDGLATDALKGLNVVFGMFIAELHNLFKDSATSVLPTPLPFFMIMIGLFMAGFPQDDPQNTRWSDTMLRIMISMTTETSDVRRYWDHLGASAILLGIFFSRNARRILSSPFFNFLGSVSFPVYLMHNTFIKTVLTWMVYLPSALNPPTDEKGEPRDLQRGTTLHIIVAIAIFYYVLYRSAALWTQYVDPVCAQIVSSFVSWAYSDSREQEARPILNSNGHAKKSETVLPT